VNFQDITDPLASVAQHYHFHKPPALFETIREFLLKALRMLNEWWRQLFMHSGQSLNSKSLSSVLQFIVILAAVAAVFAVIYVLLRRVAMQQRERVQTIKGATAVEELLNAEGWKTQAEKLASRQDYRGACRAVYLSLLQNLDENKIAQFAPTKTNYEYSYALAQHPELQKGFRRLADLVEVIWFGNKEADKTDFQQSMNWLTELSSDIKTDDQTKAGGSP
jgi:hypothetical protein